VVLCDQPLISSQALGALSTSEDSQVVEGLRVKMLQDCDSSVRYEAGKSLLHLSVLDADVLQFLLTYLGNGSPELQIELLQLLQADEILSQLANNWEQSTHEGLCHVFH